jgi:Ca2+-binding EF-hand superfamily protein
MWRTHFKVETASEILRQRLQSRPMFNVYEAFNSLDINQDGRITIDEMKRMIESRGYFVNDKDVAQVVERMDKNRDGSVTYDEFKQELMPKSPNKRV